MTNVTFSMEQVTTCLVGAPGLPTNIPCGLIVFDHHAEGMPLMNSCAPSITFLSVNKMSSSYANFKDLMVQAVIGSENFFGMA